MVSITNYACFANLAVVVMQISGQSNVLNTSLLVQIFYFVKVTCKNM